MLEQLWPSLEQKLTCFFKDSMSSAVSEAVSSATAHLSAEITQLRELNESLAARLSALEKAPPPPPAASRPYGAPPEGLIKDNNFISAVARAMDERGEREKKKTNLVIVGLPEPQPGLQDQVQQTDTEAVGSLAEKLNIHRSNITRVFRHGASVPGKNRITKVVFNCLDARRRFLSGSPPSPGRPAGP